MTNRKVTTEWIKQLIKSNNTYAFYQTKIWNVVKNLKIKREHNECERCRKIGKYSPCEAVHHKKYLRRNPELALDINNLECLCKNCHYKEHHKRDFINVERW